jgi:phage I-like protein
METGSLFLSLNFENENEIPNRIMLVPAGKTVEGRDGRKWKNPDPKIAALNSNTRLPMLPIDENHSTDLSAPKGGTAPAFGWMKNLCADESGAIWADVEWNERGREALSKKEYRYLSPVFLFSEKGEINCILRAALTNSPNFNLPALNSEQIKINTKEVPMDKELLAALGLPETATGAEALAAVKALNAAKSAAAPQKDTSTVDITAYAPRADLNAMEARAVAAEKQIADLNAAQLKKDAEAAVDEAITNRKITPASREQYLALCATKEGLEKVKDVLKTNPAVISEEQASASAPPAGNGGVALNAEEAQLAKAMSYTPGEFEKIKEREAVK